MLSALLAMKAAGELPHTIPKRPPTIWQLLASLPQAQYFIEYLQSLSQHIQLEREGFLQLKLRCGFEVLLECYRFHGNLLNQSKTTTKFSDSVNKMMRQRIESALAQKPDIKACVLKNELSDDMFVRDFYRYLAIRSGTLGSKMFDNFLVLNSYALTSGVGLSFMNMQNLLEMTKPIASSSLLPMWCYKVTALSDIVGGISNDRQLWALHQNQITMFHVLLCFHRVMERTFSSQELKDHCYFYLLILMIYLFPVGMDFSKPLFALMLDDVAYVKKEIEAKLTLFQALQLLKDCNEAYFNFANGAFILQKSMTVVLGFIKFLQPNKKGEASIMKSFTDCLRTIHENTQLGSYRLSGSLLSRSFQIAKKNKKMKKRPNQPRSSQDDVLRTVYDEYVETDSQNHQDMDGVANDASGDYESGHMGDASSLSGEDVTACRISSPKQPRLSSHKCVIAMAEEMSAAPHARSKQQVDTNDGEPTDGTDGKEFADADKADEAWAQQRSRLLG